ncbi:hypothetical protein BKA62DRAFT_775723 [Auriculariales sp. MPI-PUGE-AT-0066]|nr:hypothetical protein BKA62DRAFT_775723 [Auriculariales sp. MPI-PUGE-AT-0066]
MLLLSLEIRELKRYFTTFPDDALWIRAYILLMVCADVVCMYGGCGAAYTYLVVGWGDLSSLQFMTVNYDIYEASMSVGMILLHFFLIRRFFVLSHNRFVSFLLCLPAATACIAGLVLTYMSGVKFKKTSDRPHLLTPVTIFSLSSFVADTIIAAAMMYQLHRVQSPFDRTDGLVRRLMRNTILSGATTGVFAFVAFLLFHFNPLSNIVLIFSFNISRVGTLTVLYNLNDRRQARDQLEATEVTPVNELYHHDEAQTKNITSIHLPGVSGSQDVFGSKSYTV